MFEIVHDGSRQLMAIGALRAARIDGLCCVVFAGLFGGGLVKAFLELVDLCHQLLVGGLHHAQALLSDREFFLKHHEVVLELGVGLAGKEECQHARKYTGHELKVEFSDEVFSGEKSPHFVHVGYR